MAPQTERVTLSSGAYQSRSLIANAQRCVNLYPEAAPQETQTPSPLTHYQTPGLTLKAASPLARGGRGLYRATNGALYAVIGRNVYYISSTFQFTQLGQITDQTTQVSMVDNGIVLVLVDGTTNGYAIDMLNGNTFGQISDPNFYGANKVDYVDTYFVFNKPGSAIYYISLSEVNFAMLTGTAIDFQGTAQDGVTIGGSAAAGLAIAGSSVSAVSLASAGSGYNPSATTTNVSLVGGTGTGAIANISTNGSGGVNGITLLNGGTGYKVGDILSPDPVAMPNTTSATFSVTALAVGGVGYTPGTYTGVAMSGGTGAGMTANITVNSSGAVSAISVAFGGAGYAVGDLVTPSSAIGAGLGFQGRVTSLSAGSGYVNGQYDGVPFSGGSGTGATANVEVAGGIVTSVDMVLGGAGYKIGDVLTISNAYLGGTGSGASFVVATMAPAFDGEDFAQKAGGPDPLVSLICVHREIWLIGTLASEVAVNTGASDFTFGPLPGAYMEAGTPAPQSVARHSLSVLWLAQDRQGQNIVVQSNGYVIDRVSTYALENEFQSYATVSDAVGFTYQIGGHQFYVLTFPTQDITWVFDMGNGQWHQWAWTDTNGVLHRHRAGAYAFAYGMDLCLDWQNGNLYQLDSKVHTDNGQAISRIRSFPHLMQDGKRVTYTKFIADISVGNPALDTPAAKPMLEVVKQRSKPNTFAVVRRGGELYVDLPEQDVSGRQPLTLRYSDDRGATYSGAIVQGMGAEGEYFVSVEYPQLGMARDRVFELSWSGELEVSLNGAFIDTLDNAS